MAMTMTMATATARTAVGARARAAAPGGGARMSARRVRTSALFQLPKVTTSTKTLADFKAKTIDGKEVELSQYSGKVVLLVNVASA